MNQEQIKKQKAELQAVKVKGASPAIVKAIEERLKNLDKPVLKND